MVPLFEGTSDSTTSHHILALPEQLFHLLSSFLLALILSYYLMTSTMLPFSGGASLLSRIVARALSQYLVVEDPSAIGTRLLRTAGLTLRGATLQPMVLRNPDGDAVAVVTGTVRMVALSWQWGGSASAVGDQGRDKEQDAAGFRLVNQPRLELEGVDLTVTLLSEEETKDHAHKASGGPGDIPRTDPVEKDPPPQDASAPSGGFIQDQVNYILDDLSMDMSDLRVTLQMPSSSSSSAAGPSSALQCSMASLTLTSLARQLRRRPRSLAAVAERAFVQRLVIADLAIHGRNSMCLVEPCSYRMDCVRFHPYRSWSEVATMVQEGGLLVEGGSEEMNNMDQGLVLHLGREQLLCVNQLLEGYLRLMRSDSDMISSSGNTTQGTPSNENQRVASNSEVPGDRTNAIASESSDSAGGPAAVKGSGSYAFLSLSAVTLVLPNESRVSVRSIALDCSLDGSRCLVSGRHGILLDDFVCLDQTETCTWQIDPLSRRFLVGHDDHEGPVDETEGVAKIRVRPQELDRVKEGAQQLLNVFHELSLQNSGALRSVTQDTVERAVLDLNEQVLPNSSPGWSFQFHALDIVLEDEESNRAVECLVRDIFGRTDDMILTLGKVEHLRLPHSIRLLQPLEKTVLQFDGKVFELSIDTVVARLEEPEAFRQPVDDPEAVRQATLEKEEEKQMLSADEEDAVEPFVLPFGVHASINNMTVYKVDGKAMHTNIKALHFAVGPDLSKDDHEPTGSVRALFMVEEFNHDMLSLNQAKTSAIVHPSNLSRVDCLDFDARLIAVAVGYSVFDWVRLFETGDERREPKKKTSQKKTPIHLPFAHVHEMKIKLAVKATLVSTKDATLHLAEFQGHDKTTLNDLIVWYTQRVVSNAPHVVTNANVLGFNVSDTAANYGGTVMISGALGALGSAAAPVAGVLGMVGFDAVKNTINAGKRGRGAEDDDRRQLGDFVRGIGQLAKEAAQGGAVARGKSQDEQADALDWALGATSEIGGYADENKARLGGAGAGAVGFGYGLVLGGPVGAIAGALIASRATSTTINAVDRRLRGTKEEIVQ